VPSLPPASEAAAALRALLAVAKIRVGLPVRPNWSRGTVGEFRLVVGTLA